MPAWLVFMLGLAVLVVESVVLAVFGVEGWALQTPIALAVYLGLRRDFVASAAVLAGLVIPIEWMTGGPAGYYGLGLVVVFFAMRLARGRVQSGWGVPQAVLGLVAYLLHSLTMALAMLLLEPDSEVLAALGWAAPVGALSAMAGVLVVGWIFGRLDSWLDPRSQSGLVGI